MKRPDEAGAAPAEKLPYPKAIAFIIGNEFCERFNYYGMRAVLCLYLQKIGYPELTAKIIFHSFGTLAYFTPIFGALLADNWLGKFNTILYLSVVYILGSCTVAIGAIPMSVETGIVLTMTGLFLIGLGSGGIKPCVAAFGGDQFQLPEQADQISTFFSYFYIAINSGALLSMIVTPILRADVHCFGEKSCYPAAFSLPALLMIIALVIFVLGRPLYKIRPPTGNVMVDVCGCIGTGITGYCKERKTAPREHWLDHAEKKYDKKLIADVKVLLRVLVLYIPLPIFWTLFEQQGSAWTFQANQMNGDMCGGFTIKPDNMQLFNPLLIVILIPVCNVAIYPLLNLIGIRRPLQKITTGGILAGVAFVIAGIVHLQLGETDLPKSGEIQLRIFNGMPHCDYTLTTNILDKSEIAIKSMELFEEKHIKYQEEIQLSGSSSSEGCPAISKTLTKLESKKAYSFFINSNGMLDYLDEVDKPDRGNPLVRTLASVGSVKTIEWIDLSKGASAYKNTTDLIPLVNFKSTNYKVTLDGQPVLTTKLRDGGVYTLVIGEDSNNVYTPKLFEIAPPKSIHMLWQLPQYVVVTIGEVMFSVTGLEFTYSQAPVSMKSVLQACWLLTVAVGHFVVVVISLLKLVEAGAYELFLFAILMFIDMIGFMFMAYAYKPNDPNAADQPAK